MRLQCNRQMSETGSLTTVTLQLFARQNSTSSCLDPRDVSLRKANASMLSSLRFPDKEGPRECLTGNDRRFVL